MGVVDRNGDQQNLNGARVHGKDDAVGIIILFMAAAMLHAADPDAGSP